jgi:SAM-dependent methyltransferase/uncharacterized protein YbaR (Trm112 family)
VAEVAAVASAVARPIVDPALVLVCPACRTEAGAALLEHAAPDVLTCSRCGLSYPILHGIPLVSSELGAFIEHDLEGWIGGGPTAPEALGAALPIAAAWGDPARRLRAAGTRVQAAAAYAPGTSPLIAWVSSVLEAHAPAGASRGLDLGCGAGGAACALSARLAHVLAIDASGTALRLGRAIASGLESILVPEVGSRVRTVAVEPPPGTRADRITWLGGDVHNPPIAGAEFDVVVALNLLDTVRDPSLVLAQALAALRPHGLLILGCPFAWTHQATEPWAWLGDDARRRGPSGADRVRALVREAADVLEETEITWVIAHDARTSVSHRVACLAARLRA